MSLGLDGSRGKMDLKNAQEQFLSLLNTVKPVDIEPFLDWIKDSFSTSLVGKEPESDEKDILLHQIVRNLREIVPFNGVFPSEKFSWPENGLASDCNPKTTVHVDAFLYDDDDIDEMCESETNNGFSRNYCLSCGSHQTAPLTFVSHSASVKQLKFIFRDALPALNGKCVLDVGSRFGGILYAAYLYSNAAKIVGVELNADLYMLQKQTTEKYRMADKIVVICDDIRNRSNEVQQADVIILHNVFQFFLSVQEQQCCWHFLFENIRPGTVLVCIPNLDIVTNGLNLQFSLNDWVEPINFDHVIRKIALENDSDYVEELSKICIYQVKQRRTNA